MNIPFQFQSSASPTSAPHVSMKYSSGSIVFIVQGVQFKIPKALLQQYGGALSDMLSFEEVEDQNIILNDSSEAFSDFFQVVHCPFDSCLYPNNPTSSNLSKVLNVLRISHKYCVESIEQKARDLATTLTSEETFRRHIAPNLSAIQILEIAMETGLDAMSTVAHEVVLRDYVRSGTRSPFQVLALGERLDDQSFTSLALYQIMLLGPEGVGKLTKENRQKIRVGRERCVSAWDRIAGEWAKAGCIPATRCARPHYCRHLHDSLLQIVWICQGEKDIPSYDVLGKLDAVMEIPDLCDNIFNAVSKERATIESSLVSCFLSPVKE